MSIDVIKPGLCTTVQDAGRWGYQHLGVPVNGPMDVLAHSLANLLVGNLASCGTLEVTLQGPSLLFRTTTLLAIAGADLGAQLDGVPLPPGTAVKVQPGTLLSFAKRNHGARAYIAVGGGYMLPLVLGSSSTFRRGGLGGVNGRALLAGDVLQTRSSFRNLSRLQLQLQLPIALQPDPATMARSAIRVIPGREWQAFTEASQRALLSEPYRISNQSERMGYRLQGAPLALQAPLELLSEAVTFGTLQVPADGQPIVLMADRQTTGGYPKIAHVASVDLPLLAQRLPGEEVRFTLIAIEEAQRLAVERSRMITRLENDYAAH